MQETWTKILQQNPDSNFLQSPLWAEMNKQIGHKLVVRTFDDKALYLGIVKNAKRGRYLEIPGGPIVDWNDKELVKKIFASITEEAKKRKMRICAFSSTTQKHRGKPETY